jgi:hypothetical protein
MGKHRREDNERLRDLCRTYCSSTNILRIMKSRRMALVTHVARLKERRIANTIFICEI